MCRALVHELSREPSKTTKELLDIATRHASGEEAVRATFILGNTKAAASGGRAAPSKVNPNIGAQIRPSYHAVLILQNR
jgi:hypothetical protein